MNYVPNLSTAIGCDLNYCVIIIIQFQPFEVLNLGFWINISCLLGRVRLLNRRLLNRVNVQYNPTGIDFEGERTLMGAGSDTSCKRPFGLRLITSILGLLLAGPDDSFCSLVAR